MNLIRSLVLLAVLLPGMAQSQERPFWQYIRGTQADGTGPLSNVELAAILNAKASLTGSETLTNKTFTTPTINGATLSGNLSGTPAFTGAVTGLTAAAGTNTTQLATTAFAKAEIAAEAVRYDASQSLTDGQVTQALNNQRIVHQYYPISSEASLRAAITAANNAGGGTVNIPPGIITLTQALPTLGSGTNLIGFEPATTATNDTSPGEYFSLTGNTVLRGDGTFNCIEINATDAGSPATPWHTGMLKQTTIKNIGFDNFLNGIKIGSVNQGGSQQCTYEKLYFTGCRQWAMDTANCIFDQYNDIYIFCPPFVSGTAYCDGFRHRSVIPLATYLPTNSEFGRIFVHQEHALGKGIVFYAGDGAGLNEPCCMSGALQCNRFYQSTAIAAQAATMTNASPNITITDGTKYRVGLPVRVSATANGFTVSKRYFIKSIASNVITLANDPTAAAAAINATGNTAVNIVTNGQACLELISEGTNSSTIVNGTFAKTDLEGTTEASFLSINTNSNIFNLTEVNATLGSAVFRGGQQNITNCTNSNCEFDLDNTRDTQLYGFAKSFVNTIPVGIFRNAAVGSNVYGLNLASVRFNSTTAKVNNFDIAITAPPIGTTGIKLDRVLGQKIRLLPTASLALTGFGGVISYNGVGSTTWTLPTIVDTSTEVSDLGFGYEIYNTSAAGILTINTDGTQLFSGIAAKTSITLLPGESAKITAGQGVSSALTWLVIKSGAF